MKEVSINMQAKLSEHFTLAELCKTSYITSDGNIPSRVAIENLKRICENWLEDLRYSYNTLYGQRGVTREGQSPRSQSSLLTEGTVPVCHLTFPSLLRADSGVRR